MIPFRERAVAEEQDLSRLFSQSKTVATSLRSSSKRRVLLRENKWQVVLLDKSTCVHDAGSQRTSDKSCSSSGDEQQVFAPLPPAPMNHVQYLRAGPAEMPFRNWYTANTNHFHLTDSVGWKWKTQPDWVIKPITHDLVRRIRFWRLKISGTWF